MFQTENNSITLRWHTTRFSFAGETILIVNKGKVRTVKCSSDHCDC